MRQKSSKRLWNVAKHIHAHNSPGFLYFCFILISRGIIAVP